MRTTDLLCPGAHDAALVTALRGGDHAAFAAVVGRWRAPMMAVALRHVRGRALAEDVVQETWLCVLRGLPAFEGRSSLRTWVFAILVNRARSRGRSEHRTVPFSALGDGDPDRLPAPADAGAAPSAETAALGREHARRVRSAIDALPAAQRDVLTARVLHGRPSDEVAAALGLTRANERVLLHRARRGLREAVA